MFILFFYFQLQLSEVYDKNPQIDVFISHNKRSSVIFSEPEVGAA